MDETKRPDTTITTLVKLEKDRGHFLPRYGPDTFKPLYAVIKGDNITVTDRVIPGKLSVDHGGVVYYNEHDVNFRTPISVVPSVFEAISDKDFNYTKPCYNPKTGSVEKMSLHFLSTGSYVGRDGTLYVPLFDCRNKDEIKKKTNIKDELTFVPTGSINDLIECEHNIEQAHENLLACSPVLNFARDVREDTNQKYDYFRK